MSWPENKKTDDENFEIVFEQTASKREYTVIHEIVDEIIKFRSGYENLPYYLFSLFHLFNAETRKKLYTITST